MLCRKCGKYPRVEHRTICGKCRYLEVKGYQQEYLKNPIVHERVLKNGKRIRKERFEFVKAIKEKSKCIDCGISDWRVLDFDHNGDKFMGVAYLVSRKMSIKKIEAEIKKCVVRCANCHRIKTIGRR